MRRRALLATLASAAAGIAGCSGQSSSPSTDRTDASPTGETTVDGTETPAPPATDRLQFADAVGETTRERCRRALDRVEARTGASLSAPVRIEQTDLPIRVAAVP